MIMAPYRTIRNKRLGAFIPSPEEILAQTARIRPAGITEAYRFDEDDHEDWRREQERQQRILERMTAKERAATEAEERAEDERLASEAKLRRKADLIRDMAGGEPQRRASVNVGSPVSAGKQISHYPAWEAKKACKDMLAQGRSIDSIMEAFGIARSERKVRAWLEGLREQQEQRMLHVTAKVTKLGKFWRVTDAQGAPLKTPSGAPLDKGGYSTPGEALARVNLINAKRAPTKKQKRAARSAEIARSREGRGGAVHARKGDAHET